MFRQTQNNVSTDIRIRYQENARYEIKILKSHCQSTSKLMGKKIQFKFVKNICGISTFECTAQQHILSNLFHQNQKKFDLKSQKHLGSILPTFYARVFDTKANFAAFL